MIRNGFRIRRLGWLGVAGTVALVFAGVSAQAALRAIVEHSGDAIATAPQPVGYEAEDHFPGSAYLYVADENAAPAKGATGTAALPDLPLPPEAASLAADGSIHAAAPFSMRYASATDRGRALQCLTAAIYYEAASEPDAGQQAVAQVILNRVRHPAFPATVCGVIYQGSERTTGCQFSYACDGSMARIPAKAYWNRAMRVAAQALNGAVYAPVGMATHYHTYAVTPSWNRSLVMTAAIGAHFFHRWQGYWGTPGAFRQAYRGGEPLPGPHPRADVPEVPVVTLAAAAAVPPALQAPTQTTPQTVPATIQPAYAQSGMPTNGYTPAVAKAAAKVATAPLPGDSQILDRWKDSGKPLR
ncbi:cell wall hydrolase [Sphingomonas alpina]|uniref:Cell wall hydrolase n=1 Tax=Sphingomonas alpina TaxID=653931 RepID=A0A7H0LKA9_9SPHN|nr:cell wall hydrolase [Sphingomonas alpina]QNQ10112.1 cell wall hydrolase [Sphingomonas alpina]